MKAFIYNGEAYIRCIPSKALFHSTIVYEVVNRGDIFAMRVADQVLTIIPGSSTVEHYEMIIYEKGFEPMAPSQKKLSALEKLQSIKHEIQGKLL
jgi:hypothetical protein